MPQEICEIFLHKCKVYIRQRFVTSVIRYILLSLMCRTFILKFIWTKYFRIKFIKENSIKLSNIKIGIQSICNYVYGNVIFLNVELLISEYIMPFPMIHLSIAVCHSLNETYKFQGVSQAIFSLRSLIIVFLQKSYTVPKDGYNTMYYCIHR